MPERRRSLAAIMFTDVVGYTALMGASEERALGARRRHGEIVPDLVRRYGGEPVHDRGDETLSTFASALDAVNCALAVQQATARDRDLDLRIGIHLGDTLFENGDVTGDGVNIAARIRPLAEPGTVCVSGEVWNAVRNHAHLDAKPLGEHALRNVARPVPVFEITGTPPPPDDAPARAWLAASEPSLREIADRFVGRDRERAELDTAIGDVLAGRGRLFFFAGEPGIGKTRLAEEVANDAGRRGARVFWGRTWESEGAPPYWPWIQILRGLAGNADAEELRARIGAGLPDLAPLLPELGTALSEGAPGADTAGDDAIFGSSSRGERQRFRLFDAVTQWVTRTAEDAPLVLVFDDLQWADAPTLLLVRFLAREIRSAPVLLLATYRDVEARSREDVGELLSSLAREGQVIHVGGLEEAEVGRLVAAWDPGQASGDLVARIHRRTEGNPFFIDGILRLLASDSVALAPDSLPVPGQIRDAVRERLRLVPEDTRRLLAVAAALGREFDHAALAAVAGMAEDAMVAALEDAARLAVIREASPLRSRFAHDLFREVLLEDLPAADRMKLHAHVGSTLETFYGEQAETHAAELALHFSAALPAGDPKKALHYGMLAARQATASFAWEDAIRELERVLAILDLDPSAREATRLEALLRLGQAKWHSEDPRGYRETYAEAMALARKLSRPRELGMAVLGWTGGARSTGFLDESRVGPIEEALSTLGETDPALRCRLLIQLTWERASPDRDQRAPTEESVRLARQVGNPGLLATALWQRHEYLEGVPEDLEERAAIGDEIFEAARRSGDRRILLGATATRIVNLHERGEVAAVDAELESYARLANEIRDPSNLWLASALHAARALANGHWDAAARFSAEAFTSAQVTYPDTATIVLGAQQYLLLYERGRIAELIPSVREYVSRYPDLPVWRATLAAACADLGDAGEARAQIEVLATNEFESLPVGPMRPGMLAQIAIALGFLGDARRAAVLYPRVLPFTGLNMLMKSGIGSFGAADRFLGLLAATMSRWEDGERHFEDALAMNRRMGARPFVARTQHDYASMLLRRGEEGDAARAEALLVEATATARDLGMARLLELAEEALADAKKPEATASGASPATAADAAPGPELRRTGDSWAVRYEGEPFILADSKGLHYLARLLAEPGRELHVLDLVAAVEGTPVDGTRAHVGDTGEILDERARSEYRERLADLQRELDEATDDADAGRADRLRQEIELIGAELSAAYGLGGRARKGGSVAERARKAVANRIRFALDRIGRHDPALATHLAAAVRTGLFCTYEPPEPVQWLT